MDDNAAAAVMRCFVVSDLQALIDAQFVFGRLAIPHLHLSRLLSAVCCQFGLFPVWLFPANSQPSVVGL